MLSRVRTRLLEHTCASSRETPCLSWSETILPETPALEILSAAQGVSTLAPPKAPPGVVHVHPSCGRLRVPLPLRLEEMHRDCV